MRIVSIEPIRTLGMMHIAAAAGLEVVLGHGFGCEAVGPLTMRADVVTEPIILDRSAIKISNEPGFGVALNPEALERVRKV